jgi:hypothetical protein
VLVVNIHDAVFTETFITCKEHRWNKEMLNTSLKILQQNSLLLEKQQAWDPEPVNCKGKATVHAGPSKWSCAKHLTLPSLVPCWLRHLYLYVLGHIMRLDGSLCSSTHRNCLKDSTLSEPTINNSKCFVV